MNNLKRTKPPNPKRSFRVPRSCEKGIGIVHKAIAKFYTAEEHDKVKTYRRSEITPEAVIEDFLNCDIPYHKVIKDEHYWEALDIVTEWFKPKEKYCPVHYCDLRYYPWTLGTSVEAPYSEDVELKSKVAAAYKRGELPHGKMTFGNCFNYVFEHNRPIVHLIKEGKEDSARFRYWNKAHSRSHLVDSETPDKVRSVHGVPKLTLMVELMFLWPLLYFMRLGSTPIAWGYETMMGGIMRIYNEASDWKVKLSCFLCLDWKQFDKRARFSVIDDIHSRWRSFMDFTGYYPTKGEYSKATADPIRMNRLWKWMTDAVKHTPVRLPDGSEWMRRHSTIASGLLQTQLLGTWYNAIMVVTCLLSLGIPITHMYKIFLGDDSFIGLPSTLPLITPNFLGLFAAEAKRRFGAVLNMKKTSMHKVLNGCNFLGYDMINGLPTRDETSLLAQLCYPERHWDVNRLASRAIGIAYANMGIHPRVYEVCKDVYDFCTIQCKATPDPIGARFVTQISRTFEIDVTHFPTESECSSKKFMVCKGLDPSTNVAFFTPKYFKTE